MLTLLIFTLLENLSMTLACMGIIVVGGVFVCSSTLSNLSQGRSGSKNIKCNHHAPSAESSGPLQALKHALLQPDLKSLCDSILSAIDPAQEQQPSALKLPEQSAIQLLHQHL